MCCLAWSIFWSSSTFHWCIAFGILSVFVYTARLSVYDRSQDGRRITEGGSSSQNLPFSSLPGSFIVFPPRIGLLSGGRMDGRSLGVVRNFHSIQIWCLAVALLYIGRAGLKVVGFQQNEGNSSSGCLVIFFFSLLICLCPLCTLWFVGINSDFVGMLGSVGFREYYFVGSVATDLCGRKTRV